MRSSEHRRVPEGRVRCVASDARRAGRDDRPGQEPRRNHPGVYLQVRIGGNARCAPGPRVQPAGVAVPVPLRRERRGDGRVRRDAMVAETAQHHRPASSRQSGDGRTAGR